MPSKQEIAVNNAEIKTLTKNLKKIARDANKEINMEVKLIARAQKRIIKLRKLMGHFETKITKRLAILNGRNNA